MTVGQAKSRRKSDRLRTYRAKRDFSCTEEPAGTSGRTSGRLFVVQRHRARRQHYDLRLEIDGVLVSWAVPKGPTLDPKSRRMAIQVEDHPIEYGDFEGIIPRGEYGGGDVIVWDRGTWEAVDTDDPMGAVESGNLHFDLHGQKLTGRFVLVRRGQDDSGKSNWLLLHKDDEHARPGWNPEEHPRSVKSDRTNEEVAAEPEAVWHGDRPADQAEVPLPRAESSGRGRKPAAKKSKKATTASARQSWPEPTEEELAALDQMSAKGTWQLAGQQLRVTNLDKVLFPGGGDAPGITKRELIRYYTRVAPVMLPYLSERPLNMHRFPNGVEQKGFWHKEIPSYAPDWLRRWHHSEADPGESQWYLVPDSVPALAWLANYGAVELHPWISRVPDVHNPTWALFDIDPGSKTSFDDVLTLARLHRTALEHLGVIARPKVTGKGGIQIWVPIEPKYTFEQTRSWVQEVSRAIGDAVPDLVSWAWEKKQRRGLARLDYTQNVINKTLVAPYSVRPQPGAPVSVPIEWDELEDPQLAPDRWTIRDVFARLESAGDPFAALLGVEQELPEPH